MRKRLRFCSAIESETNNQTKNNMTTTTKTIRTLNDATEEKRLADAKQARIEELRAQSERDMQIVNQETMREYPQIGMLSSGKFYAYIGTERRYFESDFVRAVADQIIRNQNRDFYLKNVKKSA